mmetsp:Transcript_87535/g.243762  ORF Transcript_87535/g.243762 Transcript_87535/m.243762 type:complete len:183 (-) Transcript_87535:226-774(-)
MMSCCAPAAAADVQRVVMCAPGGGQLRAVSACAQEPGGAFHPASHKELGDEKALLKTMATEFFEKVLHGISVSLVDPSDGSSIPYTFQIDECFKHGYFHIDGRVRHCFRLKSLVAPFAGREVRRMFPDIHDFGDCVLLRTRGAAQSIICRLPDAAEAKRFHTCMSVLHISVSLAFSEDDAAS